MAKSFRDRGFVTVTGIQDPDDDYTLRRDEVAQIIQRIADEGLPGPRDLDVALDAIESIFEEYGELDP